MDFWLYAVRVQQFKNFANAAARHCDVSGEVLATGDVDTRLCQRWKAAWPAPCRTRGFENAAIRRNAIDHRRRQSLVFLRIPRFARVIVTDSRERAFYWECLLCCVMGAVSTDAFDSSPSHKLMRTPIRSPFALLRFLNDCRRRGCRQSLLTENK